MGKDKRMAKIMAKHNNHTRDGAAAGQTLQPGQPGQSGQPGQPDEAPPAPPLLEVNDLSVAFPTDVGPALAVDSVSFTLFPGQTLCLVGESGCGKSMTALAIMGLNPAPGKITNGHIKFMGRNLVGLSDKHWSALRGDEMTIIFQEPMTSLNPVFSVGDQVAEVLMLHRGLSRQAALAEAAELFRRVGIPAPQERIRDFPHQLSGGMRQRVMIAMAIACSPRLLIADEPTTALDVTIQRQILELLAQLATEAGTATLLITHDLGVVAELGGQVAVMYAGRIVESAPAHELMTNPGHPYTLGLIGCRPKLPAPGVNLARDARLPVIPGNVPGLTELPSGCTFRDRCPHAMPVCTTQIPDFHTTTPEHHIRCWLFAPGAAGG